MPTVVIGIVTPKDEGTVIRVSLAPPLVRVSAISLVLGERISLSIQNLNDTV